MQYQVANYQVLVTDQDEALDFYVNKLGMQVRADVTMAEMGDFRWLVVGPAAQPEIGIVLMAVPGEPIIDRASADQPEIGIVLMGVPGEPIVDQETADQLRTLLAKGIGSTVFLTTDDCRAAYEELSARGVEFYTKPEEQPYGIDAGSRDPFGNQFRLTQVREGWGDAVARG